jgi:hypothetical protein
MLPEVSIHLEQVTITPDSPEWQIEHVPSTPIFSASLRFDGKTAEEIESELDDHASDRIYNKCALFVQLTQAALAQDSTGYPVYITYYTHKKIFGEYFSLTIERRGEWRYAHVPIVPIPLIERIASWGFEPFFWTCLLNESFSELPSEGNSILSTDVKRLISKGIIKYWMCQFPDDYLIYIHYPSKSIDDIRRLLRSTLIEAQ